VDKAVELRESLVEEERADWPCVWQQGESPDWLAYDCMYLTGRFDSNIRGTSVVQY
jgi:hypothetical protein